MPKATQQRPPKKSTTKKVTPKKASTKKKVSTPARPTGGVWDNLIPVFEVPRVGMKVNLYGKCGTGKTTLACTFPKPLLILGTENGTRSVYDVKGVDYLNIRSGIELQQALESFPTERYKSAVLDSVTRLQDIVLCEVLGIDKLPAQLSWGLAKQQQWQEVGFKVKEYMKAFFDLAESFGLNAIATAQERTFDNDGEDELLRPFVCSALTPSASGWLNESAEYVCQTLLRKESQESVMTIGDEDVVQTVETGEVEYALRVGPHPIYYTKFRKPKRAKRMPDFISDPDYNKVVKLIEG